MFCYCFAKLETPSFCPFGLKWKFARCSGRNIRRGWWCDVHVDEDVVGWDGKCDDGRREVGVETSLYEAGWMCTLIRVSSLATGLRAVTHGETYDIAYTASLRRDTYGFHLTFHIMERPFVYESLSYTWYVQYTPLKNMALTSLRYDTISTLPPSTPAMRRVYRHTGMSLLPLKPFTRVEVRSL